MIKELTEQELKNTCVEILKEFDKICEENNLKYSAAGGTMLGAVRHKGFIPWDDDIDIIMLREDYEKLLALQFENDNYEIKNYRYTKSYYYSFTKMIDKRTVITEDSRADRNMGVYIDIFPSDYIDEVDSKKFEKTIKKCQINKAIVEHLGSKIGFNKSLSIKYICKLIVRAVLAPFKKALIKKCDKQFSKNKTGKYCASLNYNVYGLHDYYESKLWNNLIQLDFEDMKVWAFEDSDSYLKMLYGDYMKLPPEEERISHHSFTAYKKTN